MDSCFEKKQQAVSLERKNSLGYFVAVTFWYRHASTVSPAVTEGQLGHTITALHPECLISHQPVFILGHKHALPGTHGMKWENSDGTWTWCSGLSRQHEAVFGHSQMCMRRGAQLLLGWLCCLNWLALRKGVSSSQINLWLWCGDQK